MSDVIQETPQAAARRILSRFLSDGYKATGLHCYRGADGTPLFWRARCKHPDGRKEIRPFRWNGTEYVPGEPLAPAAGKPLYRLPELLAADPAAPVWIVEGEACADALAKRGLIATTSGSSSSAGASDWTPLQGRSARLWPDHDEAGTKYADDVDARLRALGCAVERVDVDALDLPDKGDCVDWLAMHPDATTADVEALATVIPARARADAGPRLILTRGDAITPEAMRWIWDGWLAAGKMHLIGGQPGTGKTTIATALGATITLGGRWPDGTHAGKGTVVMWSGEDDPKDTLMPRFRAAGADMTRVFLVDGIREDGERLPFDPACDTDLLREALAGQENVRLLIVDPIVSAVAGDSHKNGEVRRALQPLVDLCMELDCALLGVTHFSKGTSGRDPTERITGSLAFGALARLVMVTAKRDAEDGQPAQRILMRAKSNIGPDGGGFAYDLVQGELPGFPGVQASSVLWGQAIEGSAREILADVERQDDGERDDAPGFLRELLAYGARPAKEIFAEASSAGFSKDAMHRAKRKIGAVAVKRGGNFGGGKQEWVWQLPAEDGASAAEGVEGGAQNRPPSSIPSGDEPPSSGDREVVEL